MKPVQPEFPRPLQVDRVPRGGSVEKLEADPAELKALARRLQIPALHSLAATLKATPWRGGGLKLDGSLTADLDQISVVSLESFRTTVTFPLLRYYLPGGGPAEADNDEEEADPIVGGSVDIGEAVAETLALELDPYPRKPGEAFVSPDEEAGKEGADSAFAALSGIAKRPG